MEIDVMAKEATSRTMALAYLPIITLLLLFWAIPLSAQSKKSYLGYTIEKLSSSESNTSTVIIRKGKTLLAKHKDGFGDYRASEFEFLPVLGQKDKQLVVTQFTGGIHCCRKYWVYDLKPKFRLIFRSKDYDMGDGGDIGEGIFQNLDADKELELVDRNDAFLYFDDLAYVSSPRPLLVFDYSHKTGKFRLANRKFRSYILKNEETWIKRAFEAKATTPGQYMADIFSIMLDYIYNGRRKEGWRFYEAERLSKSDEWTFHSKADILDVLTKDKAYQTIYSR